MYHVAGYHNTYPKNADTWCQYQLDKINGTNLFKGLMKRKGKEKSYLHNHSFDGMTNFDFTPTFNQAKAEAKPVQSIDTLPKELGDLRERLQNEDLERLKNRNVPKSKFIGFIHDVAIIDQLRIILTHSSLLRTYNKLVSKDILYVDATGNIVEKIKKYKRIYLYTLCLHHLYGVLTPLSMGQFISSAHSTSAIVNFLVTFRQLEWENMNGDDNTSPRIIMMDHSRALMEPFLKKYCDEDIDSHLNCLFRVVTGDETMEDLFSL